MSREKNDRLEPVFFAKPGDFGKWLKKNHATETELLVGFHKTKTGKPSMTWSESVDEALCYGWIDGIRKSIDGESYTIRFTPRKASSIWSNVNIEKVAKLRKEGRMQASGLKAFEARTATKSGIYSFEQKNTDLSAEYLKQLKANKKAWEFFQLQPPSYTKAATWWVMSAKQETTRASRLKTLIEDSENLLRVKQFRRP